jgi:transcriptional regulator with XRE-family HTH domain
MNSPELEAFASWVEALMRRRGYDVDAPRGGGKSRLADDAGVHRAAVTRLLQRQSMPDLETMRRLAGALEVPVRDMLVQSGRLTAEELPALPPSDAPLQAQHSPVRAPGLPSTITPEQAAELLGVPQDRRELFIKVVQQFLPA